MRAVGIVSEYNPLHTGHIYHIAETCRRADGCAVVAVMSGNFVQRGEFAVFDKFARAEAAVSAQGSVDLVIELPAAYAIGSAERFASAGVALIDACGVCEGVSFGSEAGDIEPLVRVAQYLNSDEFDSRMSELVGSGESYATLRQRVVEHALGSDAQLLAKPNNTLAVEYLRAMIKNKYALTPINVQRKGAEHDSAEMDGGYASASHIRELLCAGDMSAMEFVPSGAAEVFRREMQRGAGPVTTAMADAPMMAALRRMTAYDFVQLPDVSEGLEYRLVSAIEQSTTVEQAALAAKTKRYPHARIRRILLSAYLGLTHELASIPPQYIRVLAANARGRELLHDMRKCAKLPVITKPTDVNSLGDDARKLFAFETLCGDLYALAKPSVDLHTAKDDLTHSPAMVD